MLSSCIEMLLSFKWLNVVHEWAVRQKKRIEDPGKFKESMALEKAKVRANKISSEKKRNKVFRDSIRKGRVFDCISCHRLLFENGVVSYSKYKDNN